MKKTYSKPMIEFESFAMNTSIAANCEVKPWSDELYFEGFGYLHTDSDNCSYLPTHGGDGPHNMICYDVPDESYNLFNS